MSDNKNATPVTNSGAKPVSLSDYLKSQADTPNIYTLDVVYVGGAVNITTKKQQIGTIINYIKYGFDRVDGLLKGSAEMIWQSTVPSGMNGLNFGDIVRATFVVGSRGDSISNFVLLVKTPYLA